jgi:hypothetical protein
LVVAVDERGQQLWQRTYGDDGHGIFRGIVPARDDGYVLAGWLAKTRVEGKVDPWIVRVTPAGEPIWSRTISIGQDNDYLQDISRTADGGYALTGHTFSTQREGADIFVIVTDADGQQRWTTTVGTDENTTRANTILQTAAGGFMLGGEIATYLPYPYLVKLDAEGTKQWTIREDTIGAFLDIAATSQGEYLVVGLNEARCIQVSASGEVRWRAPLSGGRRTQAAAIVPVESDAYVVAGAKPGEKRDGWAGWLPPSEPPDIRVSVIPPNPTVGEEIEVNASASSASQGTIQKYEWNVPTIMAEAGNASRYVRPGTDQSPQPSIYPVFDEPGQYEVNIRLTDIRGETSTKTIKIDVTTPMPVATTDMATDEPQPTAGFTETTAPTTNPGAPQTVAGASNGEETTAATGDGFGVVWALAGIGSALGLKRKWHARRERD